MKRIIILVITSLHLIVISAQGSFNSGSAELDSYLYVIDINAKKNIPGFKTEMHQSYGVEINTIENMLNIGMAPAEVYLSLEIAYISHSTLNDVVTSYRLNKSLGWGAIANDMGITKDSDQFKTLCNKCKLRKEKENG